MKKLCLLSLTAGASLLLSACVTVFPDPKPAPTIYGFSAQPASAEASADAPIILIRQPGAPLSLQGVDIALSPDGRRLVYADGAEWAAPIPFLVQRALSDSLKSSSDVRAVMPGSGARPQYVLTLNLEHFEAEFDQGEKSAPLAKTVATATLTRMSDRSLVGSQRFTATRRAGSYNLGSITSAQEGALRELSGEVSAWASRLARQSDM